MAGLAEIGARLERLEAENDSLRARLSELEARPPKSAVRSLGPMSRRHLLRRVAGSAAAAALGAVAVSGLRGTESARAGSGSVALGGDNTADSLTYIDRANGSVLELRTTADAGVALIASATGNAAISGQSNDGIGVRGISFGGTAVKAEGVDGPGLHATSQSARGGLFGSPKAQVRLLPADRITHPASGAAGDLFVDRSGRLWYCRGGTAWRQLA